MSINKTTEKQLWDNYTVESQIAEKMNKLQLHTSTWINFKNTVEHREQIEKTIVSVDSLYEIQNQVPLDNTVVGDPLEMD